jgi:hypothetical protein
MAGHTDDTSRQLIHIPLIHAPADMGTMAQGLEAVYVDRFGRRRWQEQVALAERFWRAVRRELESLCLDYARVDLYQDGLPVCGRELDIVREAARSSENFRLLLKLADQGATVIGTEDPAMLLEEYRAIQAAAQPAANPASPKPTVAKDSTRLPVRPAQPTLLDRRDAYIAARIGRTLQPGRVGLLFLGMLHNIREHLPPDVVVRCLDVLKPVPSPTRSP